MTPVYIIFTILGLWLGYKALILTWYSIKAGIAQANTLEKQFGTDVLGAARYSMGLPPKKEPGNDAHN
jgi:hypothetical protein